MAFNLYGRNGSLADPQDVLWTHLDNAKRVAEERRDVPSSMSRNAGVSTRGSLPMFHQSIGSLTLWDDYRRWRDRLSSPLY